jgi:hypothetical protein
MKSVKNRKQNKKPPQTLMVKDHNKDFAGVLTFESRHRSLTEGFKCHFLQSSFWWHHIFIWHSLQKGLVSSLAFETLCFCLLLQKKLKQNIALKTK